jgi:APA family basic amino acid/polyamine antiporter
MRFFPVMPVIFIAAYLFVAITIAIDKPETAITATAVLAGFLVLFFIMQKRKSSSSK